MVDGLAGLVTGLFIGAIMGAAFSVDLRKERLEACIKLNMTLVDCATVNGWRK